MEGLTLTWLSPLFLGRLWNFLGHLIDDDNVNFSRGDNNRVAGPGETIELTVTLKNLWGEAHNFSATLMTTAWGIDDITDDTANFLDIEPSDLTPHTIDSGHRADNKTNPFVFSVADNMPIGTPVSFTLTITANGGLYTTTQHFSIIINDIQPSILIVDDDGGRLSHGRWGFEEYFKDALESTGFGYTIWDVQQGGSPSFEYLRNYRIVIWTTADAWRPTEDDPRTERPWGDLTLTHTDLSTLASYLENGGRLYLASMDTLFDLYHHTGRFADFGTYYLKVDSISHPADHDGHLGVSDVLGYSDDPISHGMIGDRRLTFDYWTAGIGNWSDLFMPSLRDGAIPIFQDVHGRICGLRYAGHYALVFLPFSFEAIVDGSVPSNQRVLLDRIIRWLNGVALGPDNQDPQVPQWLTVTDSVGGG